MDDWRSYDAIVAAYDRIWAPRLETVARYLLALSAPAEDARLLDIRVPAEVARVSVPLGSITVDGVSLTVNAVPAPGLIQISLIPFTLQHTTLGDRRPGDRVHLEADTIGKYVAELLRSRGDLGAS